MMKTFCAALVLSLAFSGWAGERYAYVRTYKVDGREVRLAEGETEGRLTARILDHTRNLEPIDVRVEGNRLVLPKQGGDSASYLVTWER